MINAQPDCSIFVRNERINPFLPLASRNLGRRKNSKTVKT